MYNTNPSNTPEKTLYRLIACCLIHFLRRYIKNVFSVYTFMNHD